MPFGGVWRTFGDAGGQSRRGFTNAGRGTKRPGLWLYTDNDRYYTLPYTRKNLDAFHANEGAGDYRSFEGIHGNGHALAGYIGMWDSIVADYLRRVDGG